MIPKFSVGQEVLLARKHARFEGIGIGDMWFGRSATVLSVDPVNLDREVVYVCLFEQYHQQWSVFESMLDAREGPW